MKLAKKQEILFEEECKRGKNVSAVNFEAFAEEWFEEFAKLNLKSTTYPRQRAFTQTLAGKPLSEHLRAYVPRKPSQGLQCRCGGTQFY